MKNHKRCIALMMMICGMLPAAGCTAKATNDDNVKMYCLNIGKADCIILSCADQHYLIDTGYEHTYAALDAALSALNIDHLSGVFLTHCHQDHEGGLMPLIKSNIAIDHIYAASVYYDVKEKKHPARLAAKERDMEVEWLNSGDIVDIADDYSFHVLGPVRVNEDNENNNSLVLRFTSPHGSILFAGDMKEEEEFDLLSRNLLSPCDVLKVGHHGDSGATSTAFLKAVKPRCAIILTNTGEEEDTPSSKTMSRLNAAECDVYVSQNVTGNAWLITLQNKGIDVQDISWPNVPKRQTGLKLSEDQNNDQLMLKNTTENTVSLNGCTLYFSKSDDVFKLNDIILSPSQVYTFSSKKNDHHADCVLDTKELLHDKKADTAILYDAYGRIIAICNNGIEK